ncbi:hypothetical protein IJE86_05655 [bacterium]|nr:hypothetical protein [bacterium]
MYSRSKSTSFPYIELPRVVPDKASTLQATFASNIASTSILNFTNEAKSRGYNSFGTFDLDKNGIISQNELNTAMNTMCAERPCKDEVVISSSGKRSESVRGNADGSYVKINRKGHDTILFTTYRPDGSIMDKDYHAHNGSRIIRRYDEQGKLYERVSIGFNDDGTYVQIDKVNKNQMVQK